MPEAADWTNATPPQMYGHVLRPDDLLERITYRFADPDPRLVPWVERYWSVQWSFGPDEGYRPSTLDDPSINLTLERGGVRREGTDGAGCWITGPITRGRFDVDLTETGSVVGVKFQVGGTSAFVGADLRALRDRTVPAADWFGTDIPGPDLPHDAPSAAPHLDAWLLGLGPREAPGQEEFRRVLALLEDPSTTRLDVLAERSGLGVRRLQRLFERHVGVAPKTMLVRARVMDALAAIDRKDPRDLTSLAHDLGWFDQSHFIRDVRRVIGQTPAAYARRER